MTEREKRIIQLADKMRECYRVEKPLQEESNELFSRISGGKYFDGPLVWPDGRPVTRGELDAFIKPHKDALLKRFVEVNKKLHALKYEQLSVNLRELLGQEACKEDSYAK